MKVTLKQAIIIFVTGFVVCFIANPRLYYRFALAAFGYSVSAKMGGTNLSNIVQPNINTTIIRPYIVLERIGWKVRRPFAAVLVNSRAQDYHRRQSIRLTWARWGEKMNVCVFFVVGLSEGSDQRLYDNLRKEGFHNDDLIVERYNDTYFNQAGKVLRMLKWFREAFTDRNMYRPVFFVKADSDVFLHLPNLVRHLEATKYFQVQKSSSEATIPVDMENPDSYYVGGLRLVNTSLDRDPFSMRFIEDAEAKRMNWSQSLPTYLAGGCYVMSSNLVDIVYNEALQLQNYPFEDVFITGFVAQLKLGLQLDGIPNMWIQNDYHKHLGSESENVTAIGSVLNYSQMYSICYSIIDCNIVSHEDLRED